MNGFDALQLSNNAEFDCNKAFPRIGIPHDKLYYFVSLKTILRKPFESEHNK